MYYLTKFDDVIYSGFWVLLKITPANLCKPIYDKYSTSICPFESRKCGMEGKKLQSLNISRTKKAFLKKQKTFFIVFEGHHSMKK